MLPDKRIGVIHIHFNPTQSEALPIRALSVFFCVAKESSSFIRVIRVPIIPVHLKVIHVPIIPVYPKNVIPVNLIHFNPKQSEAMPIRPLSVYSLAERKNRFSYIRVIRVPIIPVQNNRTQITQIKRMVADKRIGVSHIHFNPTQSEALPIRALSVFFCVAKESSSFIRVIRVPIIPVLRVHFNPKNL